MRNTQNLKSAHRHEYKTQTNGFTKLSSVAATAILLAVSNFAADFATINSNIENGTTAQKYYYFTSTQKKINLTKNTVKQNDFSGSVIAALSDENLNKDKDLSGYALNVKNLDFLSVKIKPRILAAGAYSSNVSQNTLNLSGSVNGTNVEARGGHSYKGTAQNNKVNITASKIDAVLGGSSRIAKANSNKVVIKSNGQTASEVRVAHGGRTWFSKNGAHNNEVTVIGSNAFWVYGGESQGGDITSNKVAVMSDGKLKSLSRGVFGGKSVNGTKGNVNQNEVTIIGSDVEASYEEDSGVYGGRAGYGNANLNKVAVISDGKNRSIVQANIYGGRSVGRSSFGAAPSEVNQNEVTLIGSEAAEIYGGETRGGNANLNKVALRSDGINKSQAGIVYGGKSLTNSADKNEVGIFDSAVREDVYGGHTGYGTGNVDANKITLSDANIGGSVYGGYNEGFTGSAINNIINLKNSVRVGGDIIGGKAESQMHISGNTLNVYSNDVTAANVKNFETYNFYLPQDTKAGSDIISLSSNEDTDLKGAKFKVTIDGRAPKLNINETVNLIKKTGASGKILTDDEIKYETASGALNDYKFEIKKTGDTTLSATLKEKSPGSKGKRLLKSAAAPTNLNGKMNDVASDAIGSVEIDLNHLENANLFAMKDSYARLAYADKLDFRSDAGAPDLGIGERERLIMSFAGINGFKANYDKSDTDLKGFAVAAGLAAKIDEKVFGLFAEHGYAKFDNPNFDGKVKNYGGGVFARFNLQNDFYVDTLLRVGKTKSEFSGYDTQATYYGANLGVGKKLNFGDFSMDNGVSYAFFYTGSDETDIGGRIIKFDDTKTNITKIYSKLIYNGEKFSPYAKAKFEYKFNSNTQIRALQDEDGLSFNPKGYSAGGELGLRYTPSQATQLNFSVTHIFGKKNETGGRADFAYKF
ncbi:autotransporter outer membrane beta-barrel domain-containing protein [Campylobacter rectus]|uniref:autotransporter outer membrane beta-barrel domain-containing protein n=1 Tax=Campylobacter rectus TaxID=203 RepID=UPI0028F152A1|nr:autotransporter outer membrane beta-barrel domain-containing protein [Campylobacter rectus]